MLESQLVISSRGHINLVLAWCNSATTRGAGNGALMNWLSLGMETDFDQILSLLRSLLNRSATVQRWWKEVVARTNSALVDTVCARYR